MNKYYTGIGSRQTPKDIMDLMTKIAQYLCQKGYILRSGGADGADTAFENGADENKKIYLPWKRFNGNMSPFIPITNEAIIMASKMHPTWEYLSDGAKMLHARNCYQVLGEKLNEPSEFVICWALLAKLGGTGQAIRVAKANNVHVYNLVKKEDREYWEKRISSDD